MLLAIIKYIYIFHSPNESLTRVVQRQDIHMSECQIHPGCIQIRVCSPVFCWTHLSLHGHSTAHLQYAVSKSCCIRTPVCVKSDTYNQEQVKNCTPIDYRNMSTSVLYLLAQDGYNFKNVAQTYWRGSALQKWNRCLWNVLSKHFWCDYWRRGEGTHQWDVFWSAP